MHVTLNDTGMGGIFRLPAVVEDLGLGPAAALALLGKMPQYCCTKGSFCS